MSEPKRWMDEGPPAAVERLLEAASAEHPPEASMSRALAALGLGASATGAAATATAATGSATTAGATTAAAAGVVSAGKATGVLAASGLAKWGLVGAALAVVSVGGTAVVKRTFGSRGAAVAQAAPPARAVGTARGGPSRGPTPHAAIPATPNVNSAPSVASASASVVAAAPDDAPPTGSHPSAKAAAHKAFARDESAASEAAPPVDAERLAEEVALVDRARGALARGDARATLTALDDYEARFSPRKFAPEALYLRMEALLRLGQTSAARSVAQRLASSYPSSPNAARARQVLGPTNP